MKTANKIKKSPKMKAPTEKKPEPISHVRVVINDTEEVDVDSRSERIYYFNDVVSVGDSAAKCSGCSMVTVHEGYQFEFRSTRVAAAPDAKRLYLCTNCSKTSLK